MKTFAKCFWYAVITALALYGSGVMPAIVPALVPTANKVGNSAKFQLGSGSPVSGDCATFDASLNITGPGTGAGCGSGGGSGSTLFSSVTTAGPSNTASETSLIGTVTGTTTIPANTFGNGTVLEARVQGFFSLPAVADSLTLRVKCGSTVLGSASFTPAAGVLTNGTFRMWLTITGQGTGASGAFMTNGLAELSGSALTPTEAKVLNTSAVSYDFTTACVMDMTAQWGSAQSGESISGTNAAAWIPGAPVTSVAGLTGAVPGQGTDAKVMTAGTVSGTSASLCTDANGGATTSGCTAGKVPWLTVTNPAAVGFAWRNQGTATVNTGASSIYMNAPSTTADSVHGYEISEPSTPVSITVGLIPQLVAKPFISCGLYVTDGTKLVSESTNAAASSSGAIYNAQYQVNQFNSVTSFQSSLVQPLVGYSISPVFFKVVDNGTNLSWSWSTDGLNFIQLYSASRTAWLSSPSAIGWFVDANNNGGSGTPAACLLMSWVQGTS